MESPYTLIPDVAGQIQIQPGSIVSRTVFGDASVKTVLMGLDTGQELSDHSASMPALVQILSGRCRFSFEDEAREVAAGTWIYMHAGLRHGVLAHEPTVLLLVLLKGMKPAPDTR